MPSQGGTGVFYAIGFVLRLPFFMLGAALLAVLTAFHAMFLVGLNLLFLPLGVLNAFLSNDPESLRKLPEMVSESVDALVAPWRDLVKWQIAGDKG